MTIILYVLCGAAIGTVAGVIGIGGGAMLVPLFIYLFKMDIYHAVGTSLAVIAPISLIGAFSHHLKGNVQLTHVLWIALGAALGMFLSGQIIQYIPAPFLRKGFAVFLLFVAAKLLIK